MTAADGTDLDPALAWVASSVGPIRGVAELVGGRTSTMVAVTAGPSRGPRDDLVLRLMTRAPWRAHGSSLTTRESEIQRMLVGSGVPAPRSVALDAEGRWCGSSAHLMTRLPGTPEVDLADHDSLDRLAQALAGIHAVRPDVEVRRYQSWAWEEKYVVPPWAADAGPWQVAFDLLRSPPPSYEPTFIHRDFQPRNVLWAQGHVSGVVDWVETSIGPAWLDVAHCCTDLALIHGEPAAEAFASAYSGRTGRERDAYWEVMDVVGSLPAPGRDSLLARDGSDRPRLEARLRAALDRI